MLLWLDPASPFRSYCFGFEYIFASNAPLSWKRITRGNQLDIIFCIFYIIFIFLYQCFFFPILFLYSCIDEVLFLGLDKSYILEKHGAKEKTELEGRI